MMADPQPLRVLIDTNVALDWLLVRKPWSDDAKPLWDARNAGRLIAYMPASAVTDVFYIGRRLTSVAQAFADIDRILSAFAIIGVNDQTLRAARALTGNDFEDNVQITCARALRLDLIVTRNTSDFSHSPVPAIEPSAIIQYLPNPQ